MRRTRRGALLATASRARASYHFTSRGSYSVRYPTLLLHARTHNGYTSRYRYFKRSGLMESPGVGTHVLTYSCWCYTTGGQQSTPHAVTGHLNTFNSPLYTKSLASNLTNPRYIAITTTGHLCNQLSLLQKTKIFKILSLIHKILKIYQTRHRCLPSRRKYKWLLLGPCKTCIFRKVSCLDGLSTLLYYASLIA